ncbi:unnamed protein product (macronuclear) [Paramecium tetraurelia]|uniref:Zinc finger C3HC4 RING-type domain-containing protein n=1 Tax=Paramecium tetraurelia TaxID=5888 RepID=A0DWW4_PARTE|nr:uncharacterized protein GSPATT00021174001 [Paramecium tetraurelia]CAK87531.1 unnamed protein product [Paramecium tetraurelia]|eukprot:XP_001454928.1 hypothetical protein (macronuclear) [Paramecium tetraurelia strain d4-2]
MYNQFIDEEGHERQIQYLVDLGFPESKARRGVEQFGYTITLEDLINRILDMSDDNSKKSNGNKVSLIHFSDSSSEKNSPFNQPLQQSQSQKQCQTKQNQQPQKQNSSQFQQQQKVQQQYQPQQQFQQQNQYQQQVQQQSQPCSFQNILQFQQPCEHDEFPKCQVCFTQPIQWLHFECKHQFCQPCVIKNIKASRIRKIEQVTCLQEDCHQKLVKEEIHLVSNELLPQIDIEPYNEPICTKCKLPQVAHKFKLFSNACDNAEFTILSACVKHDEEGNQLQRCPQCGIWVQKSKGCNSVLCSLAIVNIIGVGYAEDNVIAITTCFSILLVVQVWGLKNLQLNNIPVILIYFLLILLCIIVYPFFVAQVVIRRMKIDTQGNICYRVSVYIGIAILFLVLSCLAIFPGIIIFIVSQQARLSVFAR